LRVRARRISANFSGKFGTVHIVLLQLNNGDIGGKPAQEVVSDGRGARALDPRNLVFMKDIMSPFTDPNVAVNQQNSCVRPLHKRQF